MIHMTPVTHMTPIHSGVRFEVSDYRKHPQKTSKGTLFICSFGAMHFLMGYDGKLWRLNTTNQKGCINDRLCFCTPNRLRIDISWFRPIYTVTDKDHHAFMGWCNVYEKRRKHYNSVRHGRLENLNHLLIRLQRWTRSMLQRARALALSMALHPRLGAKSWLAELGKDILPLITVRAMHG